MFATIMISIGILCLSLIVTSVFMIVYFKALSVLTGWLEERYGGRIRHLLRKSFPNISNQSGKPRKDSKIEICCIYCFDKTYEFFKSNKRRLSKFVHSFIRESNISKDSCNKNEKGEYKYFTTNIKGFFHGYSPIQYLWLCLAAITGASLACIFLYSLSKRLNMFNPAPWEQVQMQIMCITFAVLSYYCFRKLKLLKGCNRNNSKYDCYYKKENSTHPVAIKQSHEAKYKHDGCYDNTKHTYKHPFYLLSKITHIQFPPSLFRRIIKLLVRRRQPKPNKTKRVEYEAQNVLAAYSKCGTIRATARELHPCTAWS